MSAISNSHVWLTIATIFVTVALARIINVWKNPINKLPGDELSKWTGYRWWRTQIVSNRISFQHAAHKKYGSVVRISPHEVAVSDPEAVQQIFAFGAGFCKSKWYLDFACDRDGEEVFSTITPHLHQQRRRLLATPMSESTLTTSFEPEIRRHCRFCIQLMQESLQTDEAIDILRWWSLMATDIIGTLTFGDSFHMLESGKVNQYIQDIQLGAPVAALSGAFPMLAATLKALPLAGVPGILGSRQRTYVSARQSIERYRRLLDSDQQNHVPHTLFAKIWKLHGAGSLSDSVLGTEARFFLIAGTDTTANTLTYVIYELTQHPDYQQRLIDEIASLPADFTSKDAFGLKSLRNIINETLRLHGPVQSTLPRVVPPGGMTAAGHFLPGGTTVHPQAYTLHRNEDIFPDPEAWRPERWEVMTREMAYMFLAWGSGSRICLGKNLAMMEMAVAIVEFFRAFPFGVRLAAEKGTSRAGMEHTEYPIAIPKVRSCWVIPLRAEKS